MTLLGPFDRPVMVKLLESGVLSPAPPSCTVVEWPTTQPTSTAKPCTAADERRLKIARFLARALLGDSKQVVSQLARLEAMVSQSIVVWSPSLYTTSRSELVAAICDHDDAITSTRVQILGEAIDGPRICLEWRVTGVFNNAGFLNDDVLIEPSHSQVEAAGMLACSFRDEYVTRICCPYDRIALLEQVLASSDRNPGSSEPGPAGSVHPDGVMTSGPAGGHRRRQQPERGADDTPGGSTTAQENL